MSIYSTQPYMNLNLNKLFMQNFDWKLKIICYLKIYYYLLIEDFVINFIYFL